MRINLFGIPFDSNTAKKGEIENIPGFDKVVGVDLIQKVTEQLERLNAESAQKIVQEMKEQEDSIRIIDDNVKTVNQTE